MSDRDFFQQLVVCVLTAVGLAATVWTVTGWSGSGWIGLPGYALGALLYVRFVPIPGR